MIWARAAAVILGGGCEGMPNSSSVCRLTPSSKFSTRKGGRPPLLTSTLFSFTSQMWFHRPRRSWAHFIPILGFVDITFSGLLATGPHLLVLSKTPLISVLRLWTDFRGFFTILFDLIFTFYRTEIERLRCTATSSRDFTKNIDRFWTISDA